VEAPWGFFRNTDDRYGVKVVSEEVGFLDWEIEPDMYLQPEAFPQLKAWVCHPGQLQDFAKALREAMVETDYDLEEVAKICQHCLGENGDNSVCEVPALGELNEPSLPRFLATLDVPKLKTFAMAFMEDGHDICNVSRYARQVLCPPLPTLGWCCENFGANIPGCGRTSPGAIALTASATTSAPFSTAIELSRTPFADDRRPQRLSWWPTWAAKPMTVNLGDWLQLDMDEWQVAVTLPLE
jgi:hypothetical protein